MMFGVMILVVSTLIIAPLVESNKKGTEIIINKNIQKSISEEKSICLYMNLSETSICLNKYVRGIYNYHTTEDTVKDVSWIIAHGGDCYDYSKLYESMAKARGFYAKTIIFDTNDYGHAFVVIANDDGYCTIDQTENPKCVYFYKGANPENEK